jgi:hypothetical protein
MENWKNGGQKAMKKIVKVANGFIVFDWSVGIVKKLDDFSRELNEIGTGLESGNIGVRTAEKRLANGYGKTF